MGKITFVRNVKSDTKNILDRLKLVLLKVIKNDEMDFTNYIVKEKDNIIIPVEKNNVNSNFSSSGFIYFDEGIRNYCNKYIRVARNNEMSIGYVLSDDNYIELFLPEEIYLKNDKLFDEYIIDWIADKDSFVKSQFVQKHKSLQKYLFWSGIEKGLPNHLIMDFIINDIRNLYELIKEFTDAGLNLNKINDFVKKLENFNKI
jgi:hypothetical protein